MAHPSLFRVRVSLEPFFAATVAHTIDLEFYSVFSRNGTQLLHNFLRDGVDLEYG